MVDDGDLEGRKALGDGHNTGLYDYPGVVADRSDLGCQVADSFSRSSRNYQSVRSTEAK